MRCSTVVDPASAPGGPVLRAVRRAGADHPGRSGGALAVSSTSPDGADVDEQIKQVCAAERVAVCDLADQPPFRAALIRTGDDQHRFVMTNHHIVLDGWSLPILLGEMFAELLRAAAARGRCRIAGSSAGWPAAIWMRPARRGARCWPVSTPRRWWARRTNRGQGRREVAIGSPCPSRPRRRWASWRGRVTPR